MARRFEAFRLLGTMGLKNPAQGRLFHEPADSTIGTGVAEPVQTFDASNGTASPRTRTSIGTFGRDFSPSIYHGLNDRDRLETRLTRRFLLNIFGVKNLSQIYDSSKDSQRRAEIYDRFIGEFGTMAGLDSMPFEEKEARIKQAFRTAQGVIRSFENPETGLLRNHRTTLAQTDEISAMNNPIELMRVCFSPYATRRQRFEARRKLVLADMALKVDLATEPMDKNMHEFLGLLNTLQVWNTHAEGDGGESELGSKTQLVEVVTEHSPVDYACEDVTILGEEDKPRISDYRRYMPFQMREWTDNDDRKRLVYFEHRTKDDLTYMVKMMRKDTANPLLIDDYQGVKLVFPNKKDIFAFLEMLQGKTTIQYEEIYDTIANDDKYRVTNIGSSDKLEIVKVHANIQGMQVEFQCHTIRTHMDSRYKDGIGFEEFALNRLFESGVISLLYPEDIYGIDVNEFYGNLVRERRTKVRTPDYYLPSHREEGANLIRYAQQDLTQDCAKIIDQMQEMPDILIAVGPTGMMAALEIADRLQTGNIRQYDPEFPSDPSEYAGMNVLIVDDIGERYQNVKRIKEVFPDAKVAVLAKRQDPTDEVEEVADYYGRVLGDNERLVFVDQQTESNKRPARVHAVGLLYKIVDGQIYYYVEKRESGNTYDLKLPGGSREDVDGGDLKRTFLRELNEEGGESREGLDDLYQIGDIAFPYKVSNGTGFRKGFTRAFAQRVSDFFVLIPQEDEVSQFVWATSEELTERMNQESYKNAIPEWTSQIKAREGLE